MTYYYSKLGKGFYQPLFWLVLSLVNLVKYYYRGDYFGTGLFLLLMILLLPGIIKSLYLKFTKKPILTVGDQYIFDRYSNIKYYWEDIEYLELSDNSLQVNLYQPAAYFSNIRNPFWRLLTIFKYKYLKGKSLYLVDTDRLALTTGQNGVLRDVLDYYSAQAQEKQV